MLWHSRLPGCAQLDKQEVGSWLSAETVNSRLRLGARMLAFCFDCQQEVASGNHSISFLIRLPAKNLHQGRRRFAFAKTANYMLRVGTRIFAFR